MSSIASLYVSSISDDLLNILLSDFSLLGDNLLNSLSFLSGILSNSFNSEGVRTLNAFFSTGDNFGIMDFAPIISLSPCSSVSIGIGAIVPSIALMDSSFVSFLPSTSTSFPNLNIPDLPPAFLTAFIFDCCFHQLISKSLSHLLISDEPSTSVPYGCSFVFSSLLGRPFFPITAPFSTLSLVSTSLIFFIASELPILSLFTNVLTVLRDRLSPSFSTPIVFLILSNAVVFFFSAILFSFISSISISFFSSSDIILLGFTALTRLAANLSFSEFFILYPSYDTMSLLPISPTP